MTKKLCARRE
ncbi:unnamed protein product, partial [Rotaria sordida]